ncbi:MAG TPA: SurA N-terminal domain-containing protein [Blastocatellia bacterium]|nr:SurA N-terminal domain-containing protein [Blastocatellia bacterium]
MFRFLKLIAVISLFLASLFVIACPGDKNNPGGQVAAKVGSREITTDHIDRVIKQQMEASNRNGASLTSAELANARLTVLDNLIREEALYQKAQKENLVPDETKVSEEIQRRVQEARLSKDDYEKQLKESGLSESEWRDQVKRDLAIRALNDRVNKGVEPPTTAEIEEYYTDNKSSFVADRGADISVIFTDPRDNQIPGDAVGEAAAETKIKAVYDQLKTGTDFATVAAQRSEDASAVRGGALGFRSEATLRQFFPSRPEIPQRLMSMTPGQYTEPIKDNLSGAWVILKLNNKLEQPRNLSLDDVRQNIVDTITQQRQQVLLNALVLVATADAEVQNLFAKRLVENPKAIVELKPSQLLLDSKPAQQSPQPQPRFENTNQAASIPSAGATRPAASNANRSNGASRPNGANANRSNANR